jgi:hypothetical protein
MSLDSRVPATLVLIISILNSPYLPGGIAPMISPLKSIISRPASGRNKYYGTTGKIRGLQGIILHTFIKVPCVIYVKEMRGLS